MPQTATLEALTTPSTVPAPRSAATTDSNDWVLSLPRADLALALALSDLPRTRAGQDQALGGFANPDRRAGTLGELNSAGVSQLMAWAAQGIERAGGVLALWQTACQWRTHNLNRTWATPAGKAFTRRFGSQRRTQHATDWAGKLPTVFEAATVRISITAETAELVEDLGALFRDVSAHHHSCPPMTALFRMTRHDARMTAAHFGRTLVPFLHGGYSLA